MKGQIVKTKKLLQYMLCMMITFALCGISVFADKINGKVAEGTFEGDAFQSGVALYYTNTRGGIIPTGINMPGIIFIVGMTAVAAVVVVMIVRKKMVKGE